MYENKETQEMFSRSALQEIAQRLPNLPNLLKHVLVLVAIHRKKHSEPADRVRRDAEQ